MELNWDKIYSYWSFRCEQLDSDITEGIKFREIKIADTKSRYRMNTRDWWPTSSVEKRIQSINENGLMGVYWETVTGHKRTAEMFWDFKEDKEKTALIWMAASLLETVRGLPIGWGRETRKLISEIYFLLIKEMESKDMWRWNNNTKNTLPNGIVRNTSIIKAPGDVHELIEIIAVENVLSYSTWTLVSVTSN